MRGLGATDCSDVLRPMSLRDIQGQTLTMQLIGAEKLVCDDFWLVGNASISVSDFLE
jgi:hypothetical protein